MVSAKPWHRYGTSVNTGFTAYALHGIYLHPSGLLIHDYGFYRTGSRTNRILTVLTDESLKFVGFFIKKGVDVRFFQVNFAEMYEGAAHFAILATSASLGIVNQNLLLCY